MAVSGLANPLSFRKALFLSGVAAMLLGCGPSERPAQEAAARPPDTPKLVVAADLLKQTELALLNEGRRVAVGDEFREALEVFRPGRRVKAFELRDLPASLGPEFAPRGWETDSEGFGLVVYGERVAAAVRTVSGRSESEMMDAAEAYGRLYRRLQPVEVAGQTSRYWFFESGNQRLMVCGARTHKGNWTVTLAVGLNPVMDALRMSPARAKEDALRAARAK